MDPSRPSYLHLAPIEKGLFYILIFSSLAYMVWQIGQSAMIWKKGKKPDWKPNPIRNIWVYILGQKKVQGSRPKTGAPMHLLIFYGFMALLTATTLLAIAEYGPLLGLPNFHRGGYFLVYELTFDLLGLLFVVGVGWAIYRRISSIRKLGYETFDKETGRPIRSDNPLSHDKTDLYGLWLLLALGVTGYIVEAARISNFPQAWDAWSPVGHLVSKAMPGLPDIGYKVLWWLHAILVALWLAVLPKMRLRHIVIAVLTAAGNPDQHMGTLKPISMEEVEETGKIGVAEATDYSQWHIMSLDACMSCGRCTEVCPAHNAGKSLNPKQVVADIHRSIRTGDGVPASVTYEALWACTTCNACVEACPVLIRHVDLIVDARRGLVAEGALSGSAATMLRQMGSTKHAWGQKASAREDWMKGLDIPLVRDGAPFEYLFWVGCAGATDPSAVKTTKSVASLLKKAGVSFACLGKEEACTGDPARRVGDEFLFQEHAQKNQSIFAKYGVKKVVTACPHCLNTLLNEYDQFGEKLQVVHHTQILNEMIQQRRLNPVPISKGEVTYHDPCYLARVNGESDAPRGLLGEASEFNTDKAALLHRLEQTPGGDSKLVEPEHHAKKTLCCGAGGGQMWMDDDPSTRPSGRRSRELIATGAKTVAVSCPFCRIMLDAGLKGEKGGDEIRLLDLAEMLQEANP